MVDNSGSMTEEMASLASAMPRLVEALTSGDAELDGIADFAPIESLRVGFVSSDMGSGGFMVPTCASSDFGDDGILNTERAAGTVDCSALPSFLTYDGGPTEAFVADLQCAAFGVGTSGCGFEQQLEAALKALSPAAPTSGTAAGYEPPVFFRRTAGHGDGANAGFVRDDSLLVVVELTDEEDCSARDPAIFDLDSRVYTSNLNLRCFLEDETALHPVSRYVDGLLALRRHPSRLLYVVIAGVPVDVAPLPDEEIDWELLVGPPGVRDERLVEQIDPTMDSRLVPSCNVPGRGVAFPPIRLLQVARGLEDRGARVVVGSICQESYELIADEMARAIGR